MTYTPYINLSNDELLREVSCKEGATDMEIELALRLELLMLEVESAPTPRRLDMKSV